MNYNLVSQYTPKNKANKSTGMVIDQDKNKHVKHQRNRSRKVKDADTLLYSYNKKKEENI
jgi:hypothetical protein